jgi:isoquinoline 1-oxidoreductase beta subunit
MRVRDETGGLTRRRLLIGGGAGIGLVVAWAAWPRRYAANLRAGKGESLFGPYLKIGEDGRVTVVVPQAETGQGVFTAFGQIVADELGADWRTIGVESAPLNPLYANRLFARELFAATGRMPVRFAEEAGTRGMLTVTAGSTSVRSFEAPLRAAAATARGQLCAVAASRWDVAAEACDAAGGFVVHEGKRLRFAELAAEAAAVAAPAAPPLRMTDDDRLAGESLPRLDTPAKLDGSANFAADLRLPDMVFAAIRQAPRGAVRLVGLDKAAADRVPGVLAVVDTPGWVAAVANNWWAANRALDAMRPRFATRPALDDAAVDAALGAGLESGGDRIAARGDLAAAFTGATVHYADYRVAPAVHAAIEPVAATASFADGRLQLWLPTQAPAAARATVAAALGLAPAQVVVHPMQVGGGFGRGIDSDAAIQAATLAIRLKRPVQLQWSRVEDIYHDRLRPPARARLTARLGGGRVQAWQAKIAVPRYGRAVAETLLADQDIARALATQGPDGFAVAGAEPPYAIPALAVDHHPVALDLPLGYLRGAAHGYTAFFTESFVDELARISALEPFSFRMAMLGGNPRLARCLSTLTALGGWQGGEPGTAQGLAVHSAHGSAIAVLAEARGDNGRIRVDRLAAVVDAGRLINPDLVRQQIEGGLVFGMALALGCAPGLAGGVAGARQLRDLGLPRLADAPEITVELLPSAAEPGGVSELAVPPVAPAIANALFAATGRRYRRLPIQLGVA